MKYSSLACLANEMFMFQSIVGKMLQTLDFICPKDMQWKYLMDGRQLNISMGKFSECKVISNTDSEEDIKS